MKNCIAVLGVTCTLLLPMAAIGEEPAIVSELKNAAELGIDLSTVDTVILTHNHFDHTGGLAA